MRVAHFYVPLLSFPFSSPPSISFRRIFRAKRKKRKTLEIPRMVSKKKRTKKKYRERILFFFFCFLLTALELDETEIRFKVGAENEFIGLSSRERGMELGKNLSWCKYLGGLKFGEELLLIKEIRTVLVKSFGGKIDPSWECALKI